MYSAWICVELCLIKDTHYRQSGVTSMTRVHIDFHLVTIPLMCSQITHSQVKETDDGVSLTARWFILNI